MHRKIIWPIALLGALVVAIAPAAAQGSYAPDEEGWVSLFNGADLTGWSGRDGREHGWTVEDGALVNANPGVDLVNDVPVADQELHVEFLVPEHSNSGVYLQGRYEVQICDSGSQVELNDGMCGAVYSIAAPSENAALAANEWQTFDITFVTPRFDRDGAMVKPGHIVVVHNGTQVVDADVDHVTGGAMSDTMNVPAPLMVQGDHGVIKYRNIRYRPIMPDAAPEEEFTPLFDGESLEGWHVATGTGHGKGGQWDVQDGAIRGTQDTPGNGGLLLSDQLFGNYEVRFEANPDWNIDSGFFLRCAEDGRCYQATVDYRPDGEVGTIYGEGIGAWLQPNPNWVRFYKPEQWNDVRIIIEGQPPRIQVWLNGNKIIDYVDTEERLPLEGAIGLQVHGGGDWEGRMTRFRNIRVRPIEE